MKKRLSVITIILISLISILQFKAKATSNIDIKSTQQNVNKIVSQIKSKTKQNKQIIIKKNNSIKNSDNNITNGTVKIKEEKNIILKGITRNITTKSGIKNSEGATIGIVNWRISNECVNGKSQFTFHIDSLEGVHPIFMSVTLQVVVRNGIKDMPTIYGTSNFNFNIAEIKPGSSKSLSVNPRTGYLTVYGAFATVAPNGHQNYNDIPPESILTNKRNQYFPNYTDPVSKKQVITGVRTDWAKTGSRGWNGRNAYIRKFEKEYGEQPKEKYWDLVQIHHIRPRNFGGSDSYENLVPVKYDPSHKLLNKWFRYY